MSALSPTRSAANSWTNGYFAFPPGKPLPLPPLSPDDSSAEDDTSAHDRAKQEAWDERCRRDAQTRQKRREREQAEALLGEMEWVRAGGTLRDMYGRRDVARTEQLRAEIRLQDEERRVTSLWEGYEARWKDALASHSPVTFRDIPWPLNYTPTSAQELTQSAIEEFLFASLGVRTNTVSRRDRIRASILRWHPDKISALLARVAPGEEDMVNEGIHAVFRCLKALQDAEKHP